MLNIYSSLPASWAMRFLKQEHGLNQIDYWCIYALFLNQDWEGVRTQLRYRSKKKRVMVHKFVPGDHYHVLDTKFDTLAEAQQYLTDEGWIYNGLKEVHVYRPE